MYPARLLLAVFISVTAAAPLGAGKPPPPAAPEKGEVVTFEGLYHLTPEAAERALGADKVKAMRAALEDFNAALSYRQPVHAKLQQVWRDGGSADYKGDGYELTIVKSLYQFGGGKEGNVAGYMYGPTLSFKPEHIGGPTISRVTFHPADVLQRRLK